MIFHNSQRAITFRCVAMPPEVMKHNTWRFLIFETGPGQARDFVAVSALARIVPAEALTNTCENYIAIHANLQAVTDGIPDSYTRISEWLHMKFRFRQLHMHFQAVTHENPRGHT